MIEARVDSVRRNTARFREKLDAPYQLIVMRTAQLERLQVSGMLPGPARPPTPVMAVLLPLADGV
jgi:hypothetical protein